MDKVRDAIDELKEYVERCTDHDTVLLSDPPQHRVYAVREDVDRLIGKLEQERDRLLRSLDMAKEARDRKAARLRFLSERGILLAVDGQGGMELVVDPERCRHDEDRVMRVDGYRELKDELYALHEHLDESEHEQSMYADRIRKLKRELDGMRKERDELQRKLADLSEERGFVPATDEEMAKHGWTRLPSDMDGMPICVGDKIEHAKRRGVVTAICRTYAFSSINVLFDGNEESETVMPYEVLHHREPTVADVLREFAAAWEDCLTIGSFDKLVDEYAEKLRMADGSE